MPDFANAFGRHEFAIRRLHSFLGLMPLGGYLVFHLATNAAIMDGSETYQRRSDQIQTLGPTTVLVVGWLFILLPILLHGLIGLVIVTRGKRNVLSYPYRENFRYTLERLTGVIVFFFVLWHVFHMNGWFHYAWWEKYISGPLGGGEFDPAKATTAAAAIQSSLLVSIVYFVGTLSAVYHFSNGIWTAGITWGVWATPRAQRWANMVCLLLGIGVAVIGVGALVAMLRTDVGGASASAFSLVSRLAGTVQGT